MTWTYSGNPADSVLDEIRFLSGDTNTAIQHVSDEEIAYLIATHSKHVAAAIVAEKIATTFALKADKTVGSLSIQYGRIAEDALKLADRLRAQATGYGSLTPQIVDGAPTLLGPGNTDTPINRTSDWNPRNGYGA